MEAGRHQGSGWIDKTAVPVICRDSICFSLLFPRLLRTFAIPEFTFFFLLYNTGKTGKIISPFASSWDVFPQKRCFLGKREIFKGLKIKEKIHVRKFTIDITIKK
jgi:hypothetical protein